MAAPPPTLDLTLDHTAHPVDLAALEACLHRALDGEAVAYQSISVVLTDHATVLDLNRTYLDHDYLTDVLAFNLNEPDAPIEGEVYVDLDTAHERHREFGTTFDAEVQRYALHGLLHLLGYDDATPALKAAMHAREDRYL